MPVGTSLIDAHAGGLGKSFAFDDKCHCFSSNVLTANLNFNISSQGVIGADLGSLLTDDKPLTSRLAVICGTSSCHMAVS